MASPPGGRYVRSRTRLDQQIAAETKYAPKRIRGAAANVRARGATQTRKFTMSPAKNAARRGS